MEKINWTTESEQWLKYIHDYIAQDNPSAAILTVEAIYNRTQLLLEFPEMGYKHKRNPDRNIRVLLCGHYRIAYIINPTMILTYWAYFTGL